MWCIKKLCPILSQEFLYNGQRAFLNQAENFQEITKKYLQG